MPSQQTTNHLALMQAYLGGAEIEVMTADGWEPVPDSDWAWPDFQRLRQQRVFLASHLTTPNSVLPF